MNPPTIRPGQRATSLSRPHISSDISANSIGRFRRVAGSGLLRQLDSLGNLPRPITR